MANFYETENGAIDLNEVSTIEKKTDGTNHCIRFKTKDGLISECSYASEAEMLSEYTDILNQLNT